MSPWKRSTIPGRGYPSLNARWDSKSAESIISSAEISSNAEYNLRREQQHNHLPRASRHHVKSYEPQKGTNPKNQYCFPSIGTSIDPSVFYLFTKCFPRRKEDWRVFSTLTANFDYKLISHFSCFDLFSNFWHKTSHPLKVAQNFIFLHISMATGGIHKVTVSDFKKMKTSFIIISIDRFYGSCVNNFKRQPSWK